MNRKKRTTPYTRDIHGDDSNADHASSPRTSLIESCLRLTSRERKSQGRNKEEKKRTLKMQII